MTPEENETLQQIRDALKAKGRGCGECTACCTIMRVDMSPIAPTHKPERVKCTHECRTGCAIYDKKPDSCTAFMCLWLASQLFDSSMPDKWRPDNVGAVLDVNEHGVMTVHLKHEVAFERDGPLRDLLRYVTSVDSPLFDSRFLVLDRPSGKHLMFHRDGHTEDLVPCGIGPTGLKQFRTKFPGEA